MESRLSYKTRICEFVGSISEEKSLEVLEWIKEELECHDLNQLIIKILMKSKQLFTNDNLEHLSKKISEDSNSSDHTPIYNKNFRHTTDNRNKNVSPSTSDKQIVFPLFKLPIDLITNTLLFLNEKQLLLIERCNRILYRMINNYLFLKKCRNFKNFQLDDDLLDKISNQQIECYKAVIKTEELMTTDIVDKWSII